jgi:ankyrin repeat protein
MRHHTVLVAAAALLSSVLAPATASSQAPVDDLIKAIYARDEARAIELLDAGANPNARDELTQPAVTPAAYFGLERTVQALLKRQADLRLVDVDGLNALHAAAIGGHAAIAGLLIDNGIGVNDRGGTDGMTPLANAAVRGHVRIVELLLSRGAELDIPDSGGNSPLLHAALRGRIEVVRLLLRRGARVNAASAHGWTPLMAAAWEGHTLLVRELLHAGADRTAMNAEGQTAGMLAHAAGHAEIITLLGD